MRQLLISGFMVIATVTTASALDRYPKAKRYVNQSGEIVVMGQKPQAYAEVPVRRAMPLLQIVPVIEMPAAKRPALRVVAVQRASTEGLFGAINVDPKDWPSGRTCCRPGQAYFNENPDS